jgi:hypothetical protein
MAYEQTRKKSRKTRSHNLDILSSAESPSYGDINLHPEGSKFTPGVGLVDENFTFIHIYSYIFYE